MLWCVHILTYFTNVSIAYLVSFFLNTRYYHYKSRTSLPKSYIKKYLPASNHCEAGHTELVKKSSLPKHNLELLYIQVKGQKVKSSKKSVKLTRKVFQVYSVDFTHFVLCCSSTKTFDTFFLRAELQV